MQEIDPTLIKVGQKIQIVWENFLGHTPRTHDFIVEEVEKCSTERILRCERMGYKCKHIKFKETDNWWWWCASDNRSFCSFETNITINKIMEI